MLPPELPLPVGKTCAVATWTTRGPTPNTQRPYLWWQAHSLGLVPGQHTTAPLGMCPPLQPQGLGTLARVVAHPPPPRATFVVGFCQVFATCADKDGPAGRQPRRPRPAFPGPRQLMWLADTCTPARDSAGDRPRGAAQPILHQLGPPLSPRRRSICVWPPAHHVQ